MLKRRLGKMTAIAAATAMFVSVTGATVAQAGGYGYGHYGYGHHGYSHGYKVGYGYSNYRGHYRHKRHHHGSGRSYASIIVPTIAIGVGALLYLDHKRRKHEHHHHTHHHHGCGDAYHGCTAGTAQAPVAAPPPASTRNGSIDERLAGGPTSGYQQPYATPQVAPQKSTDSPLVASNAPCKPVTSKQRDAYGRMVHYQAMLCYHTNGTAFIQPGSMVPIGG